MSKEKAIRNVSYTSKHIQFSLIIEWDVFATYVHKIWIFQKNLFLLAAVVVDCEKSVNTSWTYDDDDDAFLYILMLIAGITTIEKDWKVHNDTENRAHTKKYAKLLTISTMGYSHSCVEGKGEGERDNWKYKKRRMKKKTTFQTKSARIELENETTCDTHHLHHVSSA